MSGIADDVVELLDGYQQALADAAIVRGADPDAAWAEALRRANAYWERLDRDLPVTCAECAWLRQARAADGTVVRMCADTMLDVRQDDYVEKLMWLVAIIACPFVVLVMPDAEADDGN